MVGAQISWREILLREPLREIKSRRGDRDERQDDYGNIALQDFNRFGI